MTARLFSDTYGSACEGVEAAARAKLGRPLTEDERAGIWNVGSLMMLEVVGRDLAAAGGAQAVAAELAENAYTFGGNFGESAGALVEAVERLLGRRIGEDERAAISGLRDVRELMVVGERVRDSGPGRREAAFAEALRTGHRRRRS